MNELQIFNYGDNEIRTIEKEDGIWWVLADVCKALHIGNTSDVYNRLDSDEKGVDSIDTLGGKQNMNTVNESGLYNVILRSDKPGGRPVPSLGYPRGSSFHPQARGLYDAGNTGKGPL